MIYAKRIIENDCLARGLPPGQLETKGSFPENNINVNKLPNIIDIFCWEITLP